LGKQIYSPSDQRPVREQDPSWIIDGQTLTKVDVVISFLKTIMGRPSKKKEEKRKKSANMNLKKNGFSSKLPITKQKINHVKYLLHETEKSSNHAVTGFPSFSELTYGSMNQKGISFLLSKLNVKETDQFLDIGSGIGGVCIYAFQSFKCNCIGVEIDKERHNLAMELKERLELTHSHKSKKSNLFFINSSITNQEIILDKKCGYDITKTTKAYVCNLLFNETLNQQVTKFIGKELLYCQTIVTLKKLPSDTIESRSRTSIIIGSRNYQLSEYYSAANSCSWTDKPIKIYVYHDQ